MKHAARSGKLDSQLTVRRQVVVLVHQRNHRLVVEFLDTFGHILDRRLFPKVRRFFQRGFRFGNIPDGFSSVGWLAPHHEFQWSDGFWTALLPAIILTARGP